jgi:hypothetical protein
LDREKETDEGGYRGGFIGYGSLGERVRVAGGISDRAARGEAMPARGSGRRRKELTCGSYVLVRRRERGRYRFDVEKMGCGPFSGSGRNVAP